MRNNILVLMIVLIVFTFAYFLANFDFCGVFQILLSFIAIMTLWYSWLKDETNSSFYLGIIFPLFVGAMSLLLAYGSFTNLFCFGLNHTKNNPFALIYGISSLKCGISTLDEAEFLYCGQIFEFLRLLLVLFIVTRVMRGPFKSVLSELFNSNSNKIAEQDKKINWYKSCELTFLCVLITTTALLVPLWVSSYCYNPANAPSSLMGLVNKKYQQLKGDADAIFNSNERNTKLEEIRQKRIIFEIPENYSSNPPPLYLNPYKFYISYSMIMFLGLGVPFFIVPFYSLLEDLPYLIRLKNEYKHKLQMFDNCSPRRAILLKMSKSFHKLQCDLRKIAEKYVEYPVWFIVLGSFEFTVGYMTLNDDAMSLTVWFGMIWMLFGLVLVFIAVIYDNIFSFARNMIEQDRELLKGLSDYSTLKFFNEFRESSILGIGAWFAGAAALFSIISQAMPVITGK